MNEIGLEYLARLASLASERGGYEVTIEAFRVFGLRRYRLIHRNPRAGVANLIYKRATAKQVEEWLRAYRRGIEDEMSHAE